jgi:hypothetical protein
MRINLSELGINDGTQLPPSDLLRVFIHMSTSPILNPDPSNFYNEYSPTPTSGDDDSEGIDSPIPVGEPQIT